MTGSSLAAVMMALVVLLDCVVFADVVVVVELAAVGFVVAPTLLAPPPRNLRITFIAAVVDNDDDVEVVFCIFIFKFSSLVFIFFSSSTLSVSQLVSD